MEIDDYDRDNIHDYGCYDDADTTATALTAHLEYHDPMQGDSNEMEITFEYDSDPDEYVGGYLFCSGDATMTAYEISPFEFLGELHTKITPEIARHIYIPCKTGFISFAELEAMTDADVLKKITDYISDKFDTAVEDAPRPAKHYSAHGYWL